jgi:large subunit ribosomal protein L10
MNRDQKAVAIEEIAAHIQESEAVFAVDYRGITVAQIAELRAKLREGDATFQVVKNSLTERAADQVGAEGLKDFLAGPTALTFVRGDIAVAAKAVADYARTTQILPFKGGLMGGAALDVEQIRSLSRLPSREVLYSQLVGVVASPISGLVRTLGALIGGLAVALGQVSEKKQSGEIPAGAAAATQAPAPEAASAQEPAQEPAQESAQAEESTAAEVEQPEAEDAAQVEEQPQAKAEVDAVADAAPQDETEPEKDEPAQADDNQADVSAEAQSEDAETNPTKED